MAEAHRGYPRNRTRQRRQPARRVPAFVRGFRHARSINVRNLTIMLLSDVDIAAEMKTGDLVIDPFDPDLIQPASIDVRLDRHFRVFTTHRYTHIDPALNQTGLTTPVEVSADGFVLHPGQFALASTFETVRVGTHLAARLEGKSGLGRLGLVVHATAGFIDPGFAGQVTLELSNVAPLPIRLHVGMRIGQLCILRMSSPTTRPYGTGGRGQYQNQRGPVPSRAWRDFPPR